MAYYLYMLNGTNHDDRQPPAVFSHHARGGGDTGDWDGYDRWHNSFAVPFEAARKKLAPNTHMVLSELTAGISDWCAGGHECPDWQDSTSAGTLINRKTLGWIKVANLCAYNFARLSELGYLYGHFRFVSVDSAW